MKTISFARCAGAALVCLALAGPAWADAKDYEFQLTETELKQGDSTLSLRLVDKRTGKSVPDAVVFATRIDMAPDDMETMTSKIDPAPTSEPGIYRFNVKLTMAGNWRLSLAAKIQGETETITNRLTFKAVK